MRYYRKKRNKTYGVLAFLMSFLLFCSAIPVSAAQMSLFNLRTVDSCWDGSSRQMPKTDENGTFLITSGAELAWFADEVNSGNNKISGKLLNDIDLNQFNTFHNWVIIGESTDRPFKGTFDGNGHIVGLLYVKISQEDSSRRYAGLFGVIDGGTVKNLSVGGTVVQGYGNYPGTGGYDELYSGSGAIAGYLKNGQIIGCINYAVTKMAGDTLYRNSGGIVGINSGLVMYCVNYGKLSTDVGIAQRHVGGIAGMTYGGTGEIWYCENRGDVQGYFEVGGITGVVKNGGEVQSSSNFSEISGNSILGGIAGNVTGTSTFSDGSKKECVLNNVYNLGDVKGARGYSGSSAGGIAGKIGYEGWKDEDLPSLPVVENASATVRFSNDIYSNRGAVIGVFKSGVIGNVYGMIYDNLTPCGVEENKATYYSGAVQMKQESELKSLRFVKELGEPFVKASVNDYDTGGYPKLAWQKQTSDVMEQAADAILELKGWLTEEKQKEYGAAFTKVENTVKKYLDKLGTVVREADLNKIMEEAREELKKIKPSQEGDSELVEAIDNGIIALEEYRDTLTEQCPDLSKEQMTVLDSIVSEYVSKLEKADSLYSVKLLVRDGKDALDAKIAEYEAEKRLEEIRENALRDLGNYRKDENFGQEWADRIEEARNTGLKNIRNANTYAEVSRFLKEAQMAIDSIIDLIPEEGAWDGIEMEEPMQNDQGVYEIASGAQLAWFADQVNNHKGRQSVCGRLSNDISLGNQSWTPIGEKEVYKGTFDGNGYTVRGLFVDQADTYAGLFGTVYGTGEQSIVNLTVQGRIQCTETVSYAGGIAGYIYGKNPSSRNAVVNCHSKVDITLSKVKKNGAAAGGIAGYARYTWFRQCSNTGAVVIDSVGKGGIQFFTGGILGRTESDVSVRQSYNAGYVSGSYCAGGIAGKIGGANCEFTSDYNCGETSASTYSGGIAGVVSGSADGSKVNWCYSSGLVNLEQSGEYLGALFGGVQTGMFTNLYAWKRPDQMGRALVGFSADATAPGAFISEAELRSDAVLNALNGGGSHFIHDYLGFQNDFPILSWQLTLDDLKTGAAAELENFVSQEDYTEENWLIVQNLVARGLESINMAVTMDAVKAALTETKEAISQVESKAEAVQRKLEERKKEVLEFLENYADLSLYREAEQIAINKYLSNARKLIVYAETIEEVERHLEQTRENIDALPTAQQYQYEQDAKAAANVDSLIGNIGEVIWADYVKTSINKARAAYDELTQSQRALVTLYQTLLDAEEEYTRLSEENQFTEEDAAMAAQADQLIQAIGEVTLESGGAIKEARYVYDGLTATQKNLVRNPEILIEAEKRYDELWAAQVSAIIASIGQVTLDKLDIIVAAQQMYDSLTDSQKALVTDYQVLKDAIYTYGNLAAAKSVIEMIDGIGEVTIHSKLVIMETINAYNALTGDQQALVSNYYILQAAAEKYDFLRAIANVEQLIDAIGAVSSSSGNSISAAREAYNNLTPEQQAQITNLYILENAEQAYEALENVEWEITVPVDEVSSGGTDTDKEEVPNAIKTGTSSEKNTVKEQPEEEKKSKETQIKEETSTKEIEWSESGESESFSDDMPVLEDLKAIKKKKKTLRILGGVLGICAVLTFTAGAAVRTASKKRKKKEVHY